MFLVDLIKVLFKSYQFVENSSQNGEIELRILGIHYIPRLVDITAFHTMLTRSKVDMVAWQRMDWERTFETQYRVIFCCQLIVLDRAARNQLQYPPYFLPYSLRATAHTKMPFKMSKRTFIEISCRIMP